MPANNEPYNYPMPKEEFANVEGVGERLCKQVLEFKGI